MTFNSYLKYIDESTNKISEEEIKNFVSILYSAFLENKTIFVIGNGGSAASASHLAEDLTKYTCLTLEQEKRIKAFSLTDNTPWITAISNDNGYDRIFEQQLRTISAKGDILIAISGSGNSPNIIRAVEWANENYLSTVGITGFDGGKLHSINQHSVHIPLNDMCTVESIHTLIFHYVVIELEKMIKTYFENILKKINL